MSDRLFLILAASGIAISAASIYLLKKPEGAAGDASPVTKDGIQQLPLSKASNIWVNRELPLAQVCKIWIEPDEDDLSRIVERPKFNRDEITVFWTEVVEQVQSMHRTKRTAITSILKMLDEHGDCPSVVRNPKYKDQEKENKYSDELFAILSRVPLWKHSLDVARHMALRIGRDILIPDALITGLAHDLGKIPVYHDKGYTTGDHPIISGIVLNGMEEFTALPNHEELIQIIRSHHDLKPHNAIAALLKECDQITRNHESAQGMKQAVAVQLQQQQTDEKPSFQAVSVTASIPADQLVGKKESDNQDSHPLGLDQDKGQNYKPNRVELPWFNPDLLLTTLKKWINVTSPSTGKWGAVSTPSGMVYVNNDCLWGMLLVIAPEAIQADLKVAEADEALKRDILHTAVWTLSKERNAVAVELMHPDHYMIPVTITNGNNKELNGNPLLIPFRAEAFGVLPSELENTKSVAIRRMVKSIQPKMFREKEKE